MRILIDALGAPRKSGGMRLYVDGVIRGWLEANPQDELVILGGGWIHEEFGHHQNVRVVEWANEGAIKRIFGQLFLAAALLVWSRSNILISLSPVASPLVPRRRRTCTVQDWRHIKNPHEFGRAQMLYRKMWKRSVAGAGAVVTMSTKTQEETLNLVPRARSEVVETGRDYVQYWDSNTKGSRQDPRRVIVTFGHHSNKRPELVMGGLALLPTEKREMVELVILGARGTYQSQLKSVAESSGLGKNCTFPGFVEEAAYRDLIRSSSVIVLASSDEGFGLPVAEANYLAIPAVVASDSGLDDIHKHGIIVADPNALSMSYALQAALNGDVEMPNRENLTTWADTAQGIRTVALGALSR